MRKPREEGATRGRPGADVSEQPTLRETDYDVRGDHQVIEHAHVDQLQRGLQRLRQVLVGTARLRCARRMVVRLMCPESLCARGHAGDTGSAGSAALQDT